MQAHGEVELSSDKEHFHFNMETGVLGIATAHLRVDYLNPHDGQEKLAVDGQFDLEGEAR